MFCENCGAALREGAKFCPECGLVSDGPLPPPLDEEYSYEILHTLYPGKAVIQITLVAGLPFISIGVLVALIEGFWIVPAIMGGIVLFAVFTIAWAHKGKQKKWGVERMLWIITPEGFGAGHPPDVAWRLGLIGLGSAVLTFGRENWGVTSQGINMAKELTVVKGLPIMPWTDFISAEYRPGKRKIAMHLPTGHVGLICANPDNYAHVEQFVRLYMSKRYGERRSCATKQRDTQYYDKPLA